MLKSHNNPEKSQMMINIHRLNQNGDFQKFRKIILHPRKPLLLNVLKTNLY